MGKKIDPVLNITSVTASSARACTLEFLMSRHQSQQSPLTKTVLAMMTMAGVPSWITSRSVLNNFCPDSRATWAKDVIMMTEKTSTPSGSSRRRPTGYWY